MRAIAATNVVVVSSTEITATTGGGSTTKLGTFSLFVTTSAGTSAANGGADFTYITLEGGPTVSSISPNSGPTSGGASITIGGEGFTSSATVVIGQGNGTTGAIAATNVVVEDNGFITATTGGGAKAGTFTLYVTVTTSAGTSPGSNNAAHFTYTS